MILDARQLPDGMELQADVAVVGAGPAGIALAHRLMGSGLTVLVLEGGGTGGVTPLDPFVGEVADTERHPPLTLYRSRGLGGTSGLWGGRCLPFDRQDFEPRDHIPHSGWPISWDEMLPWYKLAAAYCQVGPFRFRLAEAMGKRVRAMVPGLAGDIDQDGLERFSPPTRFGQAYRPALARDELVMVVTGAQCTGLELAPSGTALAGLRIAAGGRTLTVKARRTVLAAGTLETTRLMLAAGLDRGRPALGRFYMCHVEGKAAVARFRPGTSVVFQYERDTEGVYFRRHFAFPDSVQKARRMTNVILRFEPPAIADPAHGDPVLSAMWLSLNFLKREYARKLASFGYRGAAPEARRKLLLSHLANVATGAPDLAAFAMDWGRRHVLARRKLPFIAVPGRDGAYTLDYNAEQVPNPDSRVGLSGLTDAFGVPRLSVDWRVTGQDLDSVITAHRLLGHALNRAAVGRLEVDEDAIRHGYNAIGGHHLGTTRMGDGPDMAVVDRNCRVFGLDNLYVAGAGVFPTSSHANPTLTIVALAVRLADHLAARAERVPPS